MPIYDQVTNPPRQALLVTDDQAAIAETREAIRRGLVTVTTPKGRDAALALVDAALADSERLTYNDLQFVRDLVDLFGAGRLTGDKYRRGRLAGLAVCLYGDRIEVFGPLCDEELDLQVVDWLDDDLPAYGWRDDQTNTLYRLPDVSVIGHLAAEAAARGALGVAA